jgi:hypothetical protein
MNKKITKFQKVYLKNYGKRLTPKEAEKRLNSLVRLLNLIQEIPRDRN